MHGLNSAKSIRGKFAIRSKEKTNKQTNKHEPGWPLGHFVIHLEGKLIDDQNYLFILGFQSILVACHTPQSTLTSYQVSLILVKWSSRTVTLTRALHASQGFIVHGASGNTSLMHFEIKMAKWLVGWLVVAIGNHIKPIIFFYFFYFFLLKDP